MQVISTFNKGICFLQRVIYIFSKCLWVVPLKDKKGITTTNAFQEILLPKDLLELSETKFSNEWLQYQGMCILINLMI